MGQAKKRGTREERIKQATDRIFTDIPPTKFFGFSSAGNPEESLINFDPDPDGLVCMVWCITEANLHEDRQDTGIDLQIGDWLFSTGTHHNVTVHGPFKKPEDAFESARVKVGATQFLRAIDSDF